MKQPFIVAELSCNHLGDLQRARELVLAAYHAGADAIKLQTWSPDTMVLDRTIMAPPPWSDRTLFALYRECWTPWDWHAELFDLARSRGMQAFSAAFDMESVAFLETLGVPMHKVASNEITDLKLVRCMARTGKPLILSGGCANLVDLSAALIVVRTSAGCASGITVLQCTSAYPAPVERANLGRMVAFRHQFDVDIGLSDHTTGIAVPVAAASLRASYIEKHLTLSRADGGPDAAFSLEPVEFAQMAVACRDAAAAVKSSDLDMPVGARALRRSLWVCADVAEGEPLVFGQNVRTARPAFGLEPSFDLDGAAAARSLRANTPLTLECICPSR